jgi:ABC-2 type transport system ATP-binding protein
MTNAISISGLTKHYKGVQALTDLSLEVPAGSVYGFLGPNGAGKTTALKVLAGLARATAGTATVNGVPVSAAGAHRRELGYLAQEPRFYGWMTGRETLRYVARFRGPDLGVEGRITHLLGRVGLADAADRRTATYSGGMRQRLGIAQALAGRPAVVLLDGRGQDGDLTLGVGTGRLAAKLSTPHARTPAAASHSVAQPTTDRWGLHPVPNRRIK